MAGNLVRRLRAAVGNGVVWGAAWFAGAMAMMGVMKAVGVVVPESIGVLDMVGMALRIGIAGGITGGVFSGVIGLLYRGRRLSEISALRFGLGGAVVSGLFLTAFMVLPALLTPEGPAPFREIRMDIVLALVFGGITAGGSLKLAQIAERREGGADTGGLADAEDVEQLGAGDPLARWPREAAATRAQAEKQPRRW